MQFVERFFECMKNQETADSDVSCGEVREKVFTADEIVFRHISICNNEKECAQCISARHLTKLSLIDMNLEYVSGMLARFRNLTHLKLSHNNIKFVSCQLAELPKLKVLDLSYNQLDEIPLAILLIKSLTKLNVQHNHIEYLPYGLLGLKKLEVFLWEENPLLSPPPSICVLGLQSIFAALRDQKKKIDLLKDWKPNYSTQDGPVLKLGKKATVEPLFKLCVDCVLFHQVNFNTMETVPPSVKSYLSAMKSSKEHLLPPLFKCGKCLGFFSKKHLFLNHTCPCSRSVIFLNSLTQRYISVRD